MGTSAKTLSRLIDLHQQGLLKNGASMIEFGAQQLFCTGQEGHVRNTIKYFSDNNPALKTADSFTDAEIKQIANGGLIGRLIEACGFEYKALDIFDAEKTILFDLNLHDPAPEMCGQFDLVTNFGTTEHIINQFKGMKTAHELARPGGIIYHDLPLTGYHNHGYFSYNPLLFLHLADANHYRIVLQHYSKGGAATMTPQFMAAHGYPDKSYYDFGIEFIFQKTIDAPFRMPLETSTSLDVNKGMWGDVNPYNDERISASGKTGASAVTLDHVPGRELQRALIHRYRQRLARLLGGR